MRLLFLLTALFVPVGNMHAQYYSFGTEPASVKWSKIESAHYKMIFPSEIDSLAREYLYLMEYSRPMVMGQQRIDPKLVPVILHPYTTKSNGCVSWAPKQVNLITTPDYTDLCAEPWIRQLTLHEQRHIAQTEHYTKGVYKVLNYIGGEQMTGVGMGLFASSYQLEGDAVATETEFSIGGRGRQAAFLQYLRYLYLTENYLSFEQMKMGSYKYNTPTPYEFGYMMMVTQRHYHDNFYFSGDYAIAVAEKFIDITGIFGKKFSRGFLSADEYYDLSKKLFTGIWRDDLKRRGEEAPFTFATHIPRQSGKKYSTYLSPVYINDTLSPLCGKVISIKSGMEYTPELVASGENGDEKRLSSHNYYSSKLSSLAGGRVYWSETVQHGPGNLSDYMEVHYFDVIKMRKGRLGRNTRYYNPEPSPDGSVVAVAEYPVKGSSNLLLLDASDASVKVSLEAPQKGQIVESAFFNGRIWNTVKLDEGISLWSVNPYDGDWRLEVPQQQRVLATLRSGSGGLYFSSDLDGVSNIYKFIPSENGEGELLRLTNSMFGVDDPYYCNGRYYLSEYGKDGYHPAYVSVDSLSPVKRMFGAPVTMGDVDILDRQRERELSDTLSDAYAFLKECESVPDYRDTVSFPSKRYRKMLNPFKIHSWAPVYFNVDRIMSMTFNSLYEVASLGAVVYSQNELNTLTGMLGYSYHNSRHSAHANATARFWNLELEAAFDYNDKDQSRFFRSDSTWQALYNEKNPLKPYLNFSLTLDCPISFNGDGWNRKLMPVLTFNYNNNQYEFGRRFCTKPEMRFGLIYYQVLPVAKTQVFPRWGFMLSAYHGVAISKSDGFGTLEYLYGYLYLPGFTRQQGLKLTAAYQKQKMDGSNYFLQSLASMPRGKTTVTPSMRYLKGTMDYVVPIWLGDISIPCVIYVKRLKLIPFCDYAMNWNPQMKRSDLWSFGTDATIDFNILRFRFETSVGIRYARVSPEMNIKRNYFHFLFNIAM